MAHTKDGSVPLAVKNLRSLFVNSAGLALQGASWAAAYPFEIRDGAMRDLVEAHHACRAKNQARVSRGEDPQVFGFKFRRKKDKCQSIRMDADKWAQTRQNGSYRDIFTPRMKSDETLPATMPHDGRLKRENTGRSRYFYIFPIPLGENQAPEQELEKGGGGVVSVDPGVRCFATLYDPQNRTVTNWGDGDVDKLYQLHYKLDRLQAMLNSNVPKTRPMNKQKQRPTIWPNGRSERDSGTSGGGRAPCSGAGYVRSWMRPTRNWPPTYAAHTTPSFCQNLPHSA